MKFVNALAIGAAAALLLSACANSGGSTRGDDAPVSAPLPTVSSFDLERYLGTWHEIARYPFAQQEDCARDTTAHYSRRADGSVGVLNRCLRADGSAMRAQAQAWVVDPSRPAVLEVSFLPAGLRWLPFGRGDYWVLDVGADYRYAVVGEPRRRYLWILSRTPQLDAATYRSILARLPALGFDPARLIISPGREPPR